MILATLIFGLTCWLGLYLLNRNPGDGRLRWAGLGLLAYAGVWAADALRTAAASTDPATGSGQSLAAALARAETALQFLPALCWTGALIYVLPQDTPARLPLLALWRYAWLPAVALCVLLGTATDFVGQGPGFALLAAAVLLPLLGMIALVWRERGRFAARRVPGLLLVATLFFLLGMALLLFSAAWLPQAWLRLLVGIDIVSLGVIMVVRDAFDQGEALVPDVVRSLDYAAFYALLFGGQVGLAMVFAGGATLAMEALLLAAVATAIAIAVFAGRVGALVDGLAFSRLPRLRQARADLRTLEESIPREHAETDLAALSDAEFARLTRRAISQFGDLSRLAASPLTYLPQIDARLTARGAPDNVLERTAELKALLAESIGRLKPRQPAAFGTAEEWRHYNALYFPYVVGLKPYSKRAEGRPPDPAAQAALDWFRSQVPERTLYNWQTAATRLVAQDLRAQWAAPVPCAEARRRSPVAS